MSPRPSDAAVAEATLRYIESRRGRLLLHAGGVADADRVLVLSGPTGSGKTTLTIACAAAGCAYVTDETLCLDPRSLQIEPFPKPLTVKSGSQRLLRDLRPARGDVDPASGTWHVEPKTLRRLGATALTEEPLRPVVLAFPDVDADADGVTVRPLSAARAAFLLGEQSSALWTVDPRPLAALHRLVTSASAYAVTYADAFAAAPVLLDLLRSTAPAAVPPTVDDEAAPVSPAVLGPARASGVDWLAIDGEAVLFDGTALHHLDVPAAATWFALDGRRALPDLVHHLADRFAADPVSVQVDVEDLLRVLRSRGLVRFPSDQAENGPDRSEIVG